MVVDLMVSNLFNFCAVVGAVVMYIAADSPLFWLGAALGLASLIILGWLLRRDISRGRALLATYQAARMIVLLAVTAGYLARRPDDVGWIWVATGLAFLAILFEPTLRLLMSKATPVAVQLPGFPEVPRPPFNLTFVVLAPFAVAAVGGLLAAVGAPGWCYLVIAAIGIVPALIMTGYAIRALLISRRSAVGVRKALQRVPTRVRRVLRRPERRRVPARHVAALLRASEPAIHCDHLSSVDGARNHQADLGAGGGSQDSEARTGASGILSSTRSKRPSTSRTTRPMSTCCASTS